MKKTLLIAALSGLAFTSSGVMPSFADSSTSAQHILTATLATEIMVETKAGSVVSSNINGDDGILSVQMTPSFRVSTNAPSNVVLIAKADTQTGQVNAFANKPGGGGQLVVLTNTGIYNPAATAVTDITGGSPVLNQNQNAIAYDFQSVTDRTNQPVFNSPAQAYNIAIDSGITFVNNTIPAIAPVTATFGSYQTAQPDEVDNYGTYKATVICQVGSV